MEHLIEIILGLILILLILDLYVKMKFINTTRDQIKGFNTSIANLSDQLAKDQLSILSKIETENAKLIDTLNTVIKLD